MAAVEFFFVSRDRQLKKRIIQDVVFYNRHLSYFYYKFLTVKKLKYGHAAQYLHIYFRV